MTLFGLEMFPNLVFSNPNPENSLTAHNAASSHKTLGVMLTIALIGVPIALAYTVSIYWIFRQGEAGQDGLLKLLSVRPLPQPYCFVAHQSHRGAVALFHGLPAAELSKWNGTTWSPAESISTASLSTSGSNLYAGGGFHSVYDIPMNGVVRWDGTRWSVPGAGSGLNNKVTKMAVSGNNLYVSGAFNGVGEL